MITFVHEGMEITYSHIPAGPNYPEEFEIISIKENGADIDHEYDEEEILSLCRKNLQCLRDEAELDW